MLNAQLKELLEAGSVEKVGGGYALTATGRDLFDRLEPLGDRAIDWAPTL
ncbi:hypothetical protein [Pseudoroseicyclus aestuarii]|uniref:HxlR family transcriptional regulator n=1 Tax=Pseudoroseicyclus aestuarii TaxID=1795041 RepID=A0A318SP34_9RHOB|nr:hypothetical protein [Pseudoroseicyclus aestuarii]PYE82573.1 hypothetical protein DFP88_104330 [Pseudoroseicyclus aestuarii]